MCIETAAVEFAVGIIGRAAMAAEVQVSGATLDPYTMAQVFRETILLGESVQLIDLNRRTNDLRLLPVATRPIITGGPSPESWRYEVRLPRPNGEDPLYIDQLPIEKRWGGGCDPCPLHAIPRGTLAGCIPSAIGWIHR